MTIGGGSWSVGNTKPRYWSHPKQLCPDSSLTTSTAAVAPLLGEGGDDDPLLARPGDGGIGPRVTMCQIGTKQNVHAPFTQRRYAAIYSAPSGCGIGSGRSKIGMRCVDRLRVQTAMICS